MFKNGRKRPFVGPPGLAPGAAGGNANPTLGSTATATAPSKTEPPATTNQPAHNEPLLSSDYLTAFQKAFEAMRDETASFVLTDGAREYAFAGFSIIVSDPPPWAH